MKKHRRGLDRCNVLQDGRVTNLLFVSTSPKQTTLYIIEKILSPFYPAYVSIAEDHSLSKITIIHAILPTKTYTCCKAAFSKNDTKNTTLERTVAKLLAVWAWIIYQWKNQYIIPLFCMILYDVYVRSILFCLIYIQFLLISFSLLSLLLDINTSSY